MQVEFEDKTYAFDLDEIELRDAIYVQNETGLTMSGLMQGFEKSDPAALLGLYWLMLKQNGVTQSIAKINFKVRKFDAALTAAFIAEAREIAENPTEEAPGVEPAPDSKQQ